MNDIVEAEKNLKGKKSLNELKQELLEQKKIAQAQANKKKNELNKKLKDIEKKEREEKSKNYLKAFNKCLDNMTEKDLEIMTNYVLSKFSKKG